MTLVAHSGLPTFERLRAEGHEILDPKRALSQDVRELHIGLLNLMPDAALAATERQFMRLVGSCNRIAQFYVHPFTVPGLVRHGAAREHVQRYYTDFDRLRDEGLDALIVTGANPANPDITGEDYWRGMIEILEWGRDNVCSVLCSCLATHAVFHHFHGIERVRLPHKRWGVYSHDVLDTSHPLVGDINTRFDAPHSHVYELSRRQMESAGARVLAHSVGAGVHLAVSEDGFRFVYFQGHPEYDTYSLLKEYKREVNRYNNKIHADYPPYPEHYFGRDTAGMLENYQVQAARARTTGRTPPEFPEDDISPLVHNTWTDTGKALFNNWLGLVYRLTDLDRHRPFMANVDPDDPLAWRTTRRA